MDSETRRIYDRMRLYFMMQEHPTWRPEALAEIIGRTARWVRQWQRRFANDASGTLTLFLSRSRAPHSRPNQTSQAVKVVIGHLRELTVRRTLCSLYPGALATRDQPDDSSVASISVSFGGSSVASTSSPDSGSSVVSVSGASSTSGFGKSRSEITEKVFNAVVTFS